MSTFDGKSIAFSSKLSTANILRRKYSTIYTKFSPFAVHNIIITNRQELPRSIGIVYVWIDLIFTPVLIVVGLVDR